MARLGGFEPPTARFVAEYSIQLSYSRASDQVAGRYANRSIFQCWKNGGEGGIRTLDTRNAYGSLAGSWFQPLTHLSVTTARILP